LCKICFWAGKLSRKSTHIIPVEGLEGLKKREHFEQFSVESFLLLKSIGRVVCANRQQKNLN
jgi:hypothetical protein